MLSCVLIQSFHSLSTNYAMHKNCLFLQMLLPLNLLGLVTDKISEGAYVKQAFIRTCEWIVRISFLFSFSVNVCLILLVNSEVFLRLRTLSLDVGKQRGQHCPHCPATCC